MRVEPRRSGVPVGDTGRFSCPARGWRQSRQAMHQSGVTEMTDTHDDIASMDIAVDLEDARAYELARMRHSAAHLMAEAVLEIFPDVKLAIGPAIENGFYYDMDLPRPLTPDDLAAIERTHGGHRRKRTSRSCARWSRARRRSSIFARQSLQDRADRRASRRTRHHDLSAGRRSSTSAAARTSSRTGEIGAFKLHSVAGAYWRGDEKRPMLQRIYGTAWPTRRNSTITSRGWRRRNGAITAAWAASSTSSRSTTRSGRV